METTTTLFTRGENNVSKLKKKYNLKRWLRSRIVAWVSKGRDVEGEGGRKVEGRQRLVQRNMVNGGHGSGPGRRTDTAYLREGWCELRRFERYVI